MSTLLANNNYGGIDCCAIRFRMAQFVYTHDTVAVLKSAFEKTFIQVKNA
jgi:hypothetical protein